MVELIFLNASLEVFFFCKKKIIHGSTQFGPKITNYRRVASINAWLKYGNHLFCHKVTLNKHQISPSQTIWKSQHVLLNKKGQYSKTLRYVCQSGKDVGQGINVGLGFVLYIKISTDFYFNLGFQALPSFLEFFFLQK